MAGGGGSSPGSGSGGGPGSDTTAIHQDGDTYGADIVIGPKDAHDLILQAADAIAWRIDHITGALIPEGDKDFVIGAINNRVARIFSDRFDVFSDAGGWLVSVSELGVEFGDGVIGHATDGLIFRNPSTHELEATTPSGTYALTPTISVPLTTKGDLLTFSSSNTRLPVGTDGQILISDSSAATGLRWGTGSGSVDATAWHETLDSFGSEKKLGTSDNFDLVLYRDSNENLRFNTTNAIFSEPIIVQNESTAITVPYHSYFRFDVNGSNLLGNVNTSTGTGAFCGYEATANPDAFGSYTVYMLVTGENYSGHGFSGYDGIFGIGTGSTAMRLYTPVAQDIILYPDATEVGRVTDLGGGNRGLRLQRPAASDSTILFDLKNSLSTGVARMNVTNDAGAFAEFGINGSAVGASTIANDESYIETIGGGLALLGGTAQILRLGANDALWARCLTTGEFLFGPNAVLAAEGRFSSSYRVEVMDNINDEVGFVAWNLNNGALATALYTVSNDAVHQGQFGITSSSAYTPSGGLLADEVFVRGLTNNVVLSALGNNKLRFLTNGTVRYEIDGNGNMAWFGASTVGQQTVTGSRVSGAALADFLTKMAATGLIIDGTSP